jgi:AraC family transcriptional regulator, regulatory protein of adaptative response / methylated-DNA-[protein]-cysteine methyltransferase
MPTTSKNVQTTAAIESDPRWAAVVARDVKADDTFYYAVKTTGVYCRPSCPARRPRPEHVHFYATRAEAEQAGFRPCKRCQPHQPVLADQYASLGAEACRFSAEASEVPDLDALAQHAGISRYHFHRIFKAVTGVTPHSYVVAQRTQKVRKHLSTSDTVTDALYDAGYHSSGQFYETSNEILGMTPSHFRAGGAQTEIRFALGECSLGSILVATSERGVCAILLGDDPEVLVRDVQDQFPQANLVGGESEFERLVAKVVGLVEAPTVGLDLPLDIRGTTFQQRVLQALRQIPAGSTASYAEIARRVGAPQSVRAVARACSANRLAVAILCHRVVRTDGALSGYRWGVERKRALLEREVHV